ncbi:MAG: 16S rRNA (cytidine(1402)-2'-O)-methyltransferase [Anaerolineales bacterium]
MGTLYLVATPIGNLEDITLRALRVLHEVQLIAAEDTRHTRKLLTRYQIKTPLLSYHEHNKQARLPELLQRLEGGSVALVSDAGTPGLSDPGYELVQAAVTGGHRVSPIPGPAAPIAALVASGLPTDRFVFLGYLPRKTGELDRLLKELLGEPRTMLAFEVPHRLRSTLAAMERSFGADRAIAVCRELTKLHEEIVRGTVAEVRAHFDSGDPRGEITLVIAGAGELAEWDEQAVRQAVAARMAQGLRRSEAAREVAAEAGWPRSTVYRLAGERE